MTINTTINNWINKYREAGDFSGEVSDQAIRNAEQILEVNFPLEYKIFTKKYGSGGICGVELLGIENENYSSVVESTQRYRNLGLPRNYIVVENVDEFVYCLNTVGDHKVIRWDERSKKEELRYITFAEYLQDTYQEAIDNYWNFH